MDYLGQIFEMFKSVLNFCWHTADRIFSYASPLGMTFVFGLIVCYVVCRYLVFPFLR